jgi:hypothetical protein
MKSHSRRWNWFGCGWTQFTLQPTMENEEPECLYSLFAKVNSLPSFLFHSFLLNTVIFGFANGDLYFIIYFSNGVRLSPLWQIFSEYFSFPCQFSFLRLLHTHHLSSGAGTIGQIVADVSSGQPHPAGRKE